jgi:alkylation response protein AidB-like acyl-CoA dehydrogenase
MLKQTSAADSGDQRSRVEAECVARARDLMPIVERAAPRIETNREIPQDVLAALHAARLFRMLIPRSCDGDEVTPADFFATVEAIAMADGSAAWCLSQGAVVSMAAAYLKPEVAREIFGASNAVVASGPSGTGAKAVTVDGGYRVTGGWKFASGSRHSTWFGGHCIVCEADGTPRIGPDGKAVERTMLFPKASATVADVWQVVGLKGTGSDDYSVRDVFVPTDYAFTRESAADRREHGPLYRFSIFNMFGIGFAGVALGIARVSLDTFITLAREKTPFGSGRLLRDSAVIQSQIGLAETKLRSARAFLLGTVQELWDAASNGASFTLDQRLMLRAASCYAINAAREVVDAVYHAAGATAIFEGNPFERRFRDINTVTQQGQAHLSNFEVVGQSLLGLQPSARL